MGMIATTQIWWFLSRASGIVAWATLGVTCVWGVLMSARAPRRVRPAWMLDLHRWLGALVVITTAIHVIALVPDNYVHFGWTEILVPNGSGWKPAAVTWGVISLYLVVVIQATSLLIRRLPRRVWHSVHLLSYVLFALATVHGALAGTDRSNRVYVLAVLVAIATLVGGVVLRVRRMRWRREHQWPTKPPVSDPSRSIA